MNTTYDRQSRCHKRCRFAVSRARLLIRPYSGRARRGVRHGVIFTVYAKRNHWQGYLDTHRPFAQLATESPRLGGIVKARVPLTPRTARTSHDVPRCAIITVPRLVHSVI